MGRPESSTPMRSSVPSSGQASVMPLQVSRDSIARATRPSGSSARADAISRHGRPMSAAVRAPATSVKSREASVKRSSASMVQTKRSG